MVFPDDEREANPASFKFFQAAQEWSRSKVLAEMSDSDSDEDEDDGEADGAEDGEAANGAGATAAAAADGADDVESD